MDYLVPTLLLLKVEKGQAANKLSASIVFYSPLRPIGRVGQVVMTAKADSSLCFVRARKRLAARPS